MTRVAALYDIHGNLPALEAVLEEVRRDGVDEIIIGGDVLPGPLPTETLATLFGLDIPRRFITGNGDRDTLALRAGRDAVAIPPAYREAMQWVADQLSAEHAEAMSRWAATVRADTALGTVLFCHATPRSDTEIFTQLTPDERLAPVFAGVQESVVVCGHTHMQFDRVVGRVRVVNAGSVGMPFGAPGAYWLLIDRAVELRRTTYDLDAAARRIRATRYPQAAEFAAKNVLQAPSERQMLQLFSSVELT